MSVGPHAMPICPHHSQWCTWYIVEVSAYSVRVLTVCIPPHLTLLVWPLADHRSASEKGEQNWLFSAELNARAASLLP